MQDLPNKKTILGEACPVSRRPSSIIGDKARSRKGRQTVMVGDREIVTHFNVTQPNLAKQDLNTLDVSALTPDTPEVISRQATINVG